MKFEQDKDWPQLMERSGDGKCFYMRLVYLGGIEVALADPRWNTDTLYTEIDTALLNYAWVKFLGIIGLWGQRGEYCAYGATVEFARQNPNYLVWFGGARIMV